MNIVFGNFKIDRTAECGLFNFEFLGQDPPQPDQNKKKELDKTI